MADPPDDAKGEWIERVLGISLTGAQPGSAQPSGVSPKIAFTQSRLKWDQTRKQIHAELQKLEQSVLAECKDEPDFATIAGNSKVLYSILDVLDERLIDKLDEALNAQTPDARRICQDQAREIIDEYLDYVASDELVRDIDDNGFIDVAIADRLHTELNEISKQLRVAA